MRMTEEVQGLSIAGRKHSKGQKIANLDLSGVVKVRRKNFQNHDTLEEFELVGPIPTPKSPMSPVPKLI